MQITSFFCKNICFGENCTKVYLVCTKCEQIFFEYQTIVWYILLNKCMSKKCQIQTNVLKNKKMIIFGN